MTSVVGVFGRDGQLPGHTDADLQMKDLDRVVVASADVWTTEGEAR